MTKQVCIHRLLFLQGWAGSLKSLIAWNWRGSTQRGAP